MGGETPPGGAETPAGGEGAPAPAASEVAETKEPPTSGGTAVSGTEPGGTEVPAETDGAGRGSGAGTGAPAREVSADPPTSGGSS